MVQFLSFPSVFVYLNVFHYAHCQTVFLFSTFLVTLLNKKLSFLSDLKKKPKLDNLGAQRHKR